MKGFLLDSSYLFALYGDEGDRTRDAEESFLDIFSRSGNVLLVPWPILYESFNTKFSGDRRRTKQLDSEWAQLEKLGRLEFLDDLPFRAGTLVDWRKAKPQAAKKRDRGLSLVDRILMAIIQDKTLSVTAILTFDVNDFRGICAKRNIEIIPGA
jgi:predicted nucleic acid-binding protein